MIILASGVKLSTGVHLPEAFVFTEQAPAVTLVVQAHFPGLSSAFVVSRPPVVIDEGNTCFMPDLLAQRLDRLVFLVWADQQAGGEPVAAQLPGPGCSLPQAQCVAEPAAFALVPGNAPEIQLGLVVIADQQRKLQPPGQLSG